MALAFGPEKLKSDPVPWSKSGRASLRTRVCAQNGLTPARHPVGLLGQRRPGSDGYARKGARLLFSGHWGLKLGSELGTRGPKDSTFSREVSLADVWSWL